MICASAWKTNQRIYERKHFVTLTPLIHSYTVANKEKN